MPPPPAQLVDDLVEEVLLRFPPKDPAALVRAALVCKRWRRLVSGPGFRRRFSEFHHTPPMLEDGGLRFAVELGGKLYNWSTKDADEEDTRWEENRVIELNTLLPVDADLTKLDVVGCMDDLGTIFVSVDDAAYAIDLKTNKAKKVYGGTIDTIVPYVSFYTPALEADGTGEGPSAGGSSA